VEIISCAARRQTKLHLAMLKAHFNDKLATIRQSLVSLQKLNDNGFATESLTLLTSGVIEKVKGILQDISVGQLFIFISKFLYILYLYYSILICLGIFRTKCIIFNKICFAKIN